MEQMEEESGWEMRANDERRQREELVMKTA